MPKGTFLAVQVTAWIPSLALAGLLLTAGCTSPTSPSIDGKDIIIFIDFSESVGKSSKSLFERDITERIIPSLSAGDRILIAPINDKTLTDYHPLVEATFPPKPKFNGWMDNSIKHQHRVKVVEKEVNELKEDLHAQVAEVFSQRNRSYRTDIFSSLVIAQKLFHNDPRRKVLILMSDMIVDYPPYRFDRMKWGSDTEQHILSELEEKGLVPKLSGVCIYVTGASARSAELAKSIGNFWQAYFQHSEADMDPSRYAHVLLHWPPSKSCSFDTKTKKAQEV